MNIQIGSNGCQLFRQGGFAPRVLPGGCAPAYHDFGDTGEPGILCDLIGNIIAENRFYGGSQLLRQFRVGPEPFLVFLAHGFIIGSPDKQRREFTAES